MLATLRASTSSSTPVSMAWVRSAISLMIFLLRAVSASAAVADDAVSGDVIVRREGAAGVIRLNRPKAINALTVEMVRDIMAGLDGFEADPGISLVLLDINMPVMDGFEVLRTMNTNHTIEDVPVIMISSDDSEEAIREAYELGASDYVNRPFDAKIVYRRVSNTIKLYAKQRRLVQMVSDQIRAREKNTDVLVGVLSQIVEFRNGESGSHVRHIRIITETLLHRLMELTSRYDLTPEQQDNIPLASALHDIGKIGIDEAILNKPGRLTAEEFAVIKTHSMLGAEMLQKTESFADQPLLQTAYEIARWHHERWDGKGYPDGLKGDDIPISAQLVSMADVYDALTSERCYKKAFPHETAVQMITNGECGAFNPLLLQCLLDVQGELKQEILQW